MELCRRGAVGAKRERESGAHHLNILEDLLRLVDRVAPVLALYHLLVRQREHHRLSCLEVGRAVPQHGAGELRGALVHLVEAGGLELLGRRLLRRPLALPLSARLLALILLAARFVDPRRRRIHLVALQLLADDALPIISLVALAAVEL